MNTPSAAAILEKSLAKAKGKGESLLLYIMHGIYVEPTKKYADIMINGGMNKTALDIVAARIAHRIAEENEDA